jgi:exonuclease III
LNVLNHQFDIIALSETWLIENNHEIVGFQNYNHVFMYRQGKIGGGVSILLKNGVQYHELVEFSLLNETIDCIYVEIKMIGKNIIIGCIYRLPNSNLTQFSECIFSILKKVSKPNKHVYLLGDYNIDLLKARFHQPTSHYAMFIFYTTNKPSY